SIEALCENINALNSGIKNIHIEENKIGKGDGVSDDTLAIQNAINNSAKIAGGLSYAKEVVLPAGIYRISSPILMNIENLTLRGEGQVVLWAAEGNYQPIIK
ncbi:MAG: glycosyl hydrolase family 28-related protein, partial [bacterium]|nr:glycosyl hydrolase family 28-related protein [bacterium]